MKKINSAGIVFVHIIGILREEYKFDVHQVNSYQNALNFFQASKQLHVETIDNNRVEIFLILGIPEKVKKITTTIENKIKNNFDRIIKGNNISVNSTGLDNLSAEFNKAIQEYTFSRNSIKYITKKQIINGSWSMNCFWGGENPDDKGYLLIDDVIEKWLELEKPIIMGKQMILQSFQLADLNGRKIIGTFPDISTGEWSLILEGGFKLTLNSAIRIHVKKLE